MLDRPTFLSFVLVCGVDCCRAVPFKSKEETKVKILRYARFYSLCRILRNLQPEERSICFRICSFSGCRPACLTTCQFTWLLSYVVGSAGSSKKKQR
ncbi:hypothetical protein V6N13_140603 [Hibiscus sabdariffa]